MRSPSFLIFASILSVSGAASACPTFPAAVQGDLGLCYTPPCTICHTTTVGNINSATQPMAVELLKLGVSAACDTTVLANALKEMETDKTSVDAAGKPATTLLEEGDDPNTDQSIGPATPDGGVCPSADGPPTVAYGCAAQAPSAQIAADPPAWQGAAAIAAIAGLFFARRRRV
jgi:hypothetical protein